MKTRAENPSLRPVVVRIEHVSHAYGAKLALQDVSLEVTHGEILGLLGPNGGGKSTLFRVLSCLLLPSSGDASIAGQSVRNAPERVRESIGVVFQSASLDKKLTVAENIRFQGELYSLRGTILQERMEALLEAFRMKERQDDRIDSLSGGLQRRVEIAKGVLHRPKVLILDEPSTGLDPAARADLWRFLRYCRDEEGTTVLLTTHLGEEAEQCDRIAILDKGILAAHGTPEGLKSEIGGDVVVLQSDRPATLQRNLRRKFRVQAKASEDEVVFEMRDAHKKIPQLVRSFAKLINSVTVRKPTLEDVFLHKTGHALRNEKDEVKAA